MWQIAVLAVMAAMVAGDSDHVCYKEGEGVQPHGTSWIWDRGGGRYKECTCPHLLPSRYTVWSMDDFCNGICYVGAKTYRYTDRDTWKELNVHGSKMNCECQQSGEKKCELRCAWAGVEHEPKEVWVQPVNRNRFKECHCPTEFPDGVIDWHPEHFCRGRCPIDGDIIYEGQSRRKQRPNGTWVLCLCKPTSLLRCTKI